MDEVEAAMGKRIMILEDEVLLAWHLADMLTDLGHDVVAQATRVPPAMDLAREADIDLAFLDVNVAGTQSFVVADILHRRGIHYVFATGYGVGGLIDGYRDALVLQKPYDVGALEGILAKTFDR